MDPTMIEVIERLRESKAEFENEERELGREEGKEYAKDFAAYGELYRVGKSDPHLPMTPDEFVEYMGGGQIETYFGDEDDPSEARIEGFIEGLRLIWDEVRNKI